MEKGEPMKDKIPINDVIRDMTFHEIGWVRKSAEYYFHREYLHEELVENTERKWWQFWKPRFVWKKVQ